jgi:hypothetical protein
MRRILYLAALALPLGLTADAAAQGGGFGGSSGGSSLGGSSGGSSFGGSSGGSGFGGGSAFGGSSGGSTFGGSSGGSAFGGSSGGSAFGGGSGSGGRGVGGGGGGGGLGASGSTSFQVSPTNILSGTFSNPMYYGRPGSSNTSMGQASSQAKGQGFGQPSIGTVTSNSGTTGGLNRSGSATVSRGMTGGLGGLGTGTNMPQVSYAATVAFRSPPISTPALRSNLQAVVARSSAIGVPGRVRVEADGDVIVLRGRVADDDEKRLVEGMIRLEPGVHEVRNELETGP